MPTAAHFTRSSRKSHFLVALFLLAGLLLVCHFSTKVKEAVEFWASVAGFCFIMGGYFALITGAHIKFYKHQNGRNREN